MRRIDRPRRRGVERHAHSPERIRRIIDAQPELRDRVAIALLARLGLRKTSSGSLRWRDIDLEAAELRVRAKGGKRPTIPIVHEDLLADLARLRLRPGRAARPLPAPPHPYAESARGPTRVIRATPIGRRSRRRSPWWVRCLQQAAAAHFPMHELRHSAVTEFLRANGRRSRPCAAVCPSRVPASTTVDVYGHLETEDLVRGMRRAGERWALSAK